MTKSKSTKAFIRSRLTFVLSIVLLTVFTVVMFQPADRATAPVAEGSNKQAVLTLIRPMSQIATVGQVQDIYWTAKDYSADSVNINLIRKVATNPDRYEFVRSIALGQSNTGRATWVPRVSDTGDLLIEIACVSSEQACRTVTDTTRPMAVVDGGRFSNTASSYEALEGLFNR